MPRINRQFYCFMSDEGGAPSDGGAGVVDAPPVDTPAPEAPSGFTIPDEYKDKPYLSNVKSVDDLYKQFDNAQKLIGTKPPSIPAKDATAEEWNQYIEKIRPASSQEYEFPAIAFSEEEAQIKEHFGKFESEEFNSKLKNIFYEAGITPKQAQILHEKYSRLLVDDTKSQMAGMETMQQERVKQLDTDLGNMFEQKYGNRAEEVIQNGKSFFNQFLSDDTRKSLPELDKRTLFAMAEFADNVKRSYGAEDTPNKLSNVSVYGNPQEKQAALVEAHGRLKAEDRSPTKTLASIEAIKREISDIHKR